MSPAISNAIPLAISEIFLPGFAEAKGARWSLRTFCPTIITDGPEQRVPAVFIRNTHVDIPVLFHFINLSPECLPVCGGGRVVDPFQVRWFPLVVAFDLFMAPHPAVAEQERLSQTLQEKLSQTFRKGF